MIKRLYLANGTLQTALAKWSEDISVDAGTANYMLSVLGLFDWAYLALNYLHHTEIIKVYLTYSGLQVDRAQDGTERYAFPAGTTVKYVLTQAEIQDATNATPLNLYPDLASPILITPKAGDYTISYPGITTQFEGGVRAYYTESDATLHIDDWFPAAGCCTIAGNGAPLIGGPYFYLTSQPYPVEVTDGFIAPNPDTDKNHHGNGNFGLGPIWALTQPSMFEGYVASGAMVMGSINTFGGQQAYTDIDQYISVHSFLMNSIDVYGGQQEYASTGEFMQGNAYIAQMLIYGSGVEYDNDIEHYIKSLVSISSITVS